MILSFFWPAQALAQDISRDLVPLVKAEKIWLDQHPNLRMAVDIDWAPFEYVDEQKQYRGMAADYIRLVEQRLGINFQIDKERPWAKMVEAVKNHDLDMFSLVVQTPQRNEYLNFTKPYISFPMVIITREDEPFIDGVDALRNKVVAVVKSYASHDLLSKNHQHLILNPVENVRKGLEGVSNGQAYAFVGNLAVAGQVIRDAGITNLKISGQTPYRFELSLAVRKDWLELIPILQKALDSITQAERDKIYNQWIKVRFQQEVDYRILLAVLGFGILVASIFFVWNRKLQKEINHRERVEKALKKESQRLDEIIWGTDVGTWEWNVETGETVLNERWAEIIGYSLEELGPITIDSWANLLHQDDLRQANELVKKNFSKELDHYQAETRMRHKNGKWIWVIDRGKVVEWTKDGKPLRMSGTHQDITERKKLDRMKNEFISTVSHELRTPLTSIKGSLGLIAGDAVQLESAKGKGMVNLAYKNTNRLIELVNDLLDIEKLESGQMEFDFKPIKISTLVTETVETNKGFATEHGVSFTIAQLDPGLRVKGDYSRLTQVLANLLSNAAKFSHDGGEITISVEKQANTVTLSVKDQGRGIPDEFRSHIFGKFAQSDASDSRQKGGSGLGLNISKSIVDFHQGTISFSSQEGKGITFYVTLPLLKG